jgi:hypothetical protein
MRPQQLLRFETLHLQANDISIMIRNLYQFWVRIRIRAKLDHVQII